MAAPSQRRATKRGRKGSRRSIVYILLGILVLLAPVILTHYKNVEQNRIAQGYSRDVQALSPEDRDKALESARRYNRELPPFGAPDPWVNGIDVNSPGYKNTSSSSTSTRSWQGFMLPPWAWIYRYITELLKARFPMVSVTSTGQLCPWVAKARTVSSLDTPGWPR